MKLWILTPVDAYLPDPPYTYFWRWARAQGFVVRAETEEQAREFVGNESGEEGAATWLNIEMVKCEELLPDGDSGVILCDYYEE